MKTNKGEKFYTRPYALWALLSSAIILVSIGGVVYDVLQGSAFTAALLERGLVALACGALSFWLAVLVSWLLPVGLSKDGIRSYTCLGAYRSVEWSQMKRVEPVSLFGIRYAKIYLESGGAPVWVPGFLSKRDRFVAQLRQRTAHSEAVERAFLGNTEGYHSGVPVTQ